jgi:hypothetical protein
MKFSEETLTALKNFSRINSGIKFYKGNTLRIKDPNGGIYAKVEIPDTIERDFCIYDLPRFLGIYSLFSDPEITLNQDDLVLQEGHKKLNYRYASENVIEFSPNKDVNFNPTKMVTFDLSQDNIQNIVKACGILQLTEIAFVGDGENITAKTIDTKDKGTNMFSLDLGKSDEVFSAIIKKDAISFLVSADYQVDIGLLTDKNGNSKVITHFFNHKYTYWIAPEISSKF